MSLLRVSACNSLLPQVEELEKQWHRENHLVAKGGVELLSLEREDFFYLTKFNEGKQSAITKTPQTMVAIHETSTRHETNVTASAPFSKTQGKLDEISHWFAQKKESSIMKPRYQIITLYFSIMSLIKHSNGWNVPFVVSKNCQPKKNIMVSITGFIFYLLSLFLISGLPLEFLRTVDIFSEFPVEQFEDEPDAISCKYYG